MAISHNPKLIQILALLACTALWAQAGEKADRTTLIHGKDPNIRVVMEGRGGNLDLQSGRTPGEGYTLTEYREGQGYVSYNRLKQELRWKSKMKYTLNRLSSNVTKIAPHMRAFLPPESELDFKLRIHSMGRGSMDFADLNLARFKMDVRYGDVDVAFPTVNQSIVRGVAKFHLMTGDMEIHDLANLKATDVKINGGVGDLYVDFGPKLHQDSDVRLDHDIGKVQLVFPKGTKVLITGTARDLTPYGFEKDGKTWRPTSFSPKSPTLRVKLTGPLGSLDVVWK